MFDALIFNSVNALEFSEIRRNVVRIPEVIHRLRQAQIFWDQSSERNLDLTNFIGSDDRTFLSHLRLKNLATAIVQLGLLDRLLKVTPLPSWVLGQSNGDSALKVATSKMTLDEMIKSSQALHSSHLQSVMNIGGLPVLAGVALGEYSLLHKGRQTFIPVVEKDLDFRRVFKVLLAQASPRRVVVVGPGAGQIDQLFKEISGGVEVVDSVSLDPLLSWFWTNQQEVAQAVQ